MTFGKIQILSVESVRWTSGSKKTQFGRYNIWKKLFWLKNCERQFEFLMQLCYDGKTGKGGKGCIALGIHYASYALYTHTHNIQAGYNYAA